MTEIRYILDAGDLARMMEIERASFPSPWEESDVLGGINSRGRLRFLGLYDGGTLLGWACFSIAFTEAHLLTLAVDPSFRGRGYGKQLLLGAMQAAADAGGQYMELECRQGNLTAQALYAGQGFVRVGRNKDYYTDTGEDALIYVKPSLPAGDPERDPFLIRE